MVAEEWLASHSGRKDGPRLVGKVSAKHLVEIGGLGAGVDEAIEDDIDENAFLHIAEHETTDMNAGISWLPKALKILLFEKCGSSSEMNTYAILDSTVWGKQGQDLSVELENSGLEWKCLFKGQAEEDNKDAAPYLVNISWENFDPDNAIPFHRALIEKYWETNIGIFFRSTASLDDLWGEFRKFTRIKDTDGKWFYLRFWEPEYFLYFFTFMKNTAAIRRLKDIPMFIFQIAGSAVSISPEYDRLSLLYTEHDEQVDLMFDASTAMVAFRHIRKLEETYEGEVDAGKGFEIFQKLFGNCEMDYTDMQDGLDVIYSVIYCYRDMWPKYLTQDVLDRCFEEDGTIDHFLTLLQGQCIFAIKNGLRPHELCFTGGIKQWQDQQPQS